MPTDYRKAFEEFQRFAQRGDGLAQFRLGLMYGLGLGVAQDYTAAIDWYERAARTGNAAAQCNLGWMFATGRGIPQDFVTALAWYSLAAAAGQDLARRNRDLLSAHMTPGQVERAQQLARDLHDGMRPPGS